MRYHSFMSPVDECVDKVTDDNQTKLNRLFQFTTGCAKDSIHSWVMLGGKDGYMEARRTRMARFGNNHLVASRLITELRRGPLASTPADIQKLSDDVRNTYMIIKSMDQLYEIDTHRMVLKIINRLIPRDQEIRKMSALKYRRDNSRYAGL